METEEPFKRFNYIKTNDDSPEHWIHDKEYELPPLQAVTSQKAQEVCEILNKQFKKPSTILTDKQINNLAYYCSMIFEMFLTVNWEYEQLGKGTTYHEVIRAGTEQLAKEYYFKGFKGLLKEMGYDKNIGDDFIE